MSLCDWREMPASVGIRGEAVAPPAHANSRTAARASRPRRIRVSPWKDNDVTTLSLARKFHELHFAVACHFLGLGRLQRQHLGVIGQSIPKFGKYGQRRIFAA